MIEIVANVVLIAMPFLFVYCLLVSWNNEDP